MTLANDLIDQVVRRLNELVPASPIHWTRVELLVYLNDGITELNLIAGDLQNVETIALNSSDNLYSVPSMSIAPLSLYTTYGYMFKESIYDLDNEVDWESPSANRLRPRTWAALGLDYVIIYPRPLAALDSTLEYMAMHDPVSDGPEELPIRKEYDIAIEDYMVSRAMFKEGGAESQQAEMLYTRFLDTVQQLAGRNVIRRYPAWAVAPETEASPVTLRSGTEGKG